MVKPTLHIHPTERDMDSVIVIKQEGDLVSDAFMMKRSALFQALGHPRQRDQYADIRYHTTLA